MKKNKFIYAAPALLGLAITLILVYTIQELREPYRLMLLETSPGKSEEYHAYYDLNGDGKSEMLNIYYNNAGNLAITIRDIQTISAINQFNLPGELTELGPTIDLRDIDSNGITDIFVCTENHDSLFLSVIDDPYGHPTRSKTFFLDQINQYNDDGDYHFSVGGLSDLDGDGSPEYICAINGGHSLQPRRVYAINYRTGQVTKSPLSGAAVIGLKLVDLNQDGKDEILLKTTAPENFKFPFPYPDSISWLMVLNPSMDFYAPPVPLSESKVRALIPILLEEKHYLILLQYLSEPQGPFNGQIILFNDQVEPVKDRYLTGDRGRSLDLWSRPGIPELKEVMLAKNDYLFQLNPDLQFIDSSRSVLHLDFEGGHLLDLDHDGSMEYVYLVDNQVTVCREGLQHPVTEALYWDERNPRELISLIEQPGEYPNLFLQVGDTRARFLYEQNPWFRYRMVVYPGMFLLLFGILLGLFFTMDKLIARRYEKDRLISQLQLQSIKNQLDPHFTYNALNAVGSLIYKEEKDLAYLYLKGLTDLLRMVSGDANSITWTLSEELEFVKKYLGIEKLRFRDRFQFQITVEEEPMNGFQVPKMSILTFVENSIKHGLRHKKDHWLLTIRIAPEGQGLKIGIRDNGIGRAAALSYREGSTGQGIDMMRRYFKQFSEATGRKARFTVTDLFGEDRRAAGTLVEITIL